MSPSEFYYKLLSHNISSLNVFSTEE